MNLPADVVILGGGCAGLWLLDELRRLGLRVLLLETSCLGGAQTTGSQGILHGGTKYALKGVLSASANSVRDMPARWRAALSGAAEPDLSQTRIRSRSCYLWRSDSWKSFAGMIGARAMLEVKPVPLDLSECPAILAKCPGQVFRLDEEVIDTVSFSRVLSERNRGLILHISSDITFQTSQQGSVTSVKVNRVGANQAITIHPQHVVLAAGAGNEQLRQQIGLPTGVTQTRPLHMVLVRGELPELNGHCIDGAKTRVTITSDRDRQNRMVWQVGGQLAEDGVRLASLELVRHAKRELAAVLPGWQPGAVEWSTYRIDRAERRTSDGSRPDDVQLMVEQNVLTIWPTKLVLAPRLADQVLQTLKLSADSMTHGRTSDIPLNSEFLTALRQQNWPAPAIAEPPWERQTTWISDV